MCILCLSDDKTRKIIVSCIEGLKDSEKKKDNERMVTLGGFVLEKIRRGFPIILKVTIPTKQLFGIIMNIIKVNIRQSNSLQQAMKLIRV